jgi:hypothetical protein
VPGLTGCGCLILVALIVGLILFMIFGSTDPGEPIEQMVELARITSALVLLGVLLVPRRRGLVRLRRA